MPLIMRFQNIFAYYKLPDAGTELYCLAAAIAIFFTDNAQLNRYEDTYADFI